MLSCLFLVDVSTAIGNAEHKNKGRLHHGSAEEGDDEHHGPRGDNVHNPEEVAEGNSEAIGGQLAGQGVEPRIGLDAVQVGLASLGPLINNVLGSNSGEVEALPVDLGLGRLREDIEDVDRSSGGGP